MDIRKITKRDKTEVVNLPKCKALIYYMSEDISFPELLSSFKAGYKKAKLFFNYDLKKEIDITLVYSRKELEEILARKTQAWEIGFTSNKTGNIIIFSPSVVEENSNHKKDDIFKTIQHELVHAFQVEVVKGFTPWWLDEGIALITAQQVKTKGRECLKSLIGSAKFFDYTTDNYRFCTSNGGYPAAYFLVENLIKDFGKGKIRSLFENSCTSKNFDLFFKEKFSVSPEDYAKKLVK